MRKVRVGSMYVYKPVMLDLIDSHTGLVEGDIVKVINVHGCPPANTMGHCYVEAVRARRIQAGQFAGMVCCNSLMNLKEASLVESVKSFEQWQMSELADTLDRGFVVWQMAGCPTRRNAR